MGLISRVSSRTYRYKKNYRDLSADISEIEFDISSKTAKPSDPKIKKIKQKFSKSMDRISSAINRAAEQAARSSTYSPQDLAIDNDYVKLPKFRPLDDFLFDLNRYSLPDHGNENRLHNRIVNNILYYQTNYISVFTFCFMTIFYLKFKSVILGFVFFTGIFYGCNWFLENRSNVEITKQTLIGGGVITWLVFMGFLGQIAIFSFGILFPV